MTSPSERYAAWAAEKDRAGTPLGAFAARFPFALDPFQLDACEALQHGRSVLVAAPTGAGKTVVGEFAVELALSTGRKVFYTAPIKALSNQKHGELVEWLGAQRVGLLTGDVSIRPEAEVVVMTTEVLRNMLYAGSSTLDGLGYVVMDEVHYLADRLRGPVWEEVIIQLPATVQLVALSATVSNAEEFGSWLDEVRGSTSVIVSETRPVPLWQQVLVGEGLLDLFVDDEGRGVAALGPGARTEKQVNPALEAIPSGEGQGSRQGGGRDPRGGRPPRHGPRGRHRRRGEHQGAGPRGDRDHRDGRGGGFPRAPRRADIVAALDEDALLPAIYFIFSRTGCDAAVRQLSMAHLRLTTPEEQRAIRRILDARLTSIPYEDEDVLQIPAFRRAAENGFAAHHAGLLPLLKTVVEELFAEGLVKVVFATETLALGINMPARSVVLEKLSKYNGVEHADLTPGEFTQLTGRAGRRGIDVEGHAVVLAGPGFDPEGVASLASRRTYPLRSAFRPTYNMVVNLLERYDADAARDSLEMSFAQFQSDRAVVGLARRARELEETLTAYRGALACDRGDIEQYAEIRAAITDRERTLSRERAGRDRDRTRTVLGSLRRGEIIALPGGKRQGFAVVVGVDKEVLGGPQVMVLSSEGRLQTLRPGDVPGPPGVVDSMRVPAPDRLGTPRVRKDTAAALRQKLSGRDDDPRAAVRRSARTPSTAASDQRLQELRAQERSHPCHDCPDLEAHLRWISRIRAVEKDRDAAVRRMEGRTSSLARQFDRVCALLLELGYLTDDDATDAVPPSAASDVEPGSSAVRSAEHPAAAPRTGLRPTDRGLRLRRLFSERDLLVAESIEDGAWDRLDAAGLAAMASAVCYTARRDDARSAELPPSAEFADALARTQRIGERLALAERRRGLDVTAPPDPSIAVVVHRWALGEHYAAAVGTSGLPAGDFVRQCRQIIDLLDQLASMPTIGPVAREAIDRVRRGFVSQEIEL
ncbi:DEAD/DEAH box helicase [Brachybacterium sp. AOP25-B2-12]|uniref:DEAD/DEAH box helicase n=1 Tax=Brachybacterium sp. AOP25-B2-12 TaxID=3457710 RepID=UPI00403323F5